MHDGLDFVSFAFVTPVGALPCEVVGHKQPSPKNALDVSLRASSGSMTPQPAPVTKQHGAKVHVRFFDTLRKTTRTQCFFVYQNTTMAHIYEMVRGWLPEVGSVVCYTVHRDTHGGLFPLVRETLPPEAEVPGVLFCQEVFLPFHKLTHCWGVVNIVVLRHYGNFVSGYIPLVVHRSAMRSRETLQEHVRQLCCASPAESNYMKSQPLLDCSVSSGSVELLSFFDACGEDQASLPQIAVVYPALTIGDLVWVEMEDRMSRRFVVQGVVKRNRQKDGILCYDVEDATTGHVLEGLTCVQVLPL